jgi:hypothetical protein
LAAAEASPGNIFDAGPQKGIGTRSDDLLRIRGDADELAFTDV